MLGVVENISFIKASRDTKSFSFSTLNSSINRCTAREIDGYEQEADIKFKAQWYHWAKTETATEDWCRNLAELLIR
jgi:hypothetical protein